MKIHLENSLETVKFLQELMKIVTLFSDEPKKSLAIVDSSDKIDKKCKKLIKNVQKA